MPTRQPTARLILLTEFGKFYHILMVGFDFIYSSDLLISILGRIMITLGFVFEWKSSKILVDEQILTRCVSSMSMFGCGSHSKQILYIYRLTKWEISAIFYCLI